MFKSILSSNCPSPPKNPTILYPYRMFIMYGNPPSLLHFGDLVPLLVMNWIESITSPTLKLTLEIRSPFGIFQKFILPPHPP